MRKMLFIKVLVIFLLIISQAALSQTYHVSGNISAGSTTVSYASITFTEESNSSNTFTTLTDTAGNYQLDIVTAIKNEPIIPQSIELAQNYPNPFSSETEIPYKLNKQSDVSIKIYNILGQEVKTFRIGTQVNGVHGVRWDGTNNRGEKVSTGIYLYQLITGNEAQVKKMLFSGNSKVINVFGTDDFSYHNRKPGKKEISQHILRAYKVQITNVDSTQPKILFTEIQNIIVKHDTTINFQVQRAEQWRFLGLENETVTAIAVDPIDPKIIYAGTLYDYSAGIQGKLFKSTDAGTTWDTLVIGGGYRNILIDPSNHNIMYASPGGIIKSEDGGKTWQPIMDGIYLDAETRVQSLAMNPKNPNVLYAGTGGFFLGNFYKSYDGGLHWTKTPSDSLRDGVVSIAVDPIDTNNVYAGTAWRGILWKSTDAGSNWFRTGLGETGLLIHDILINPDQPSTAYAGLRGIFKTEDGGINWESISEGLPILNDVIKIQKYNSSRLFIVATFGDDGGIYEYSFLQRQWIRIGINALHVSYYYSDLKIYSNPDKLYFGGKGIYVMGLK